MLDNKCFKIARQIYAAVTEVDTKQYQKAMYDFYDNKQFVDFTLNSGASAQRMFKRMYPQAVVHTLTNGNVYMKYIDTNQKIILLALLSKNGKLDRTDLQDGIQQLNFLLDQLYQGKVIQTSCNNKSLPLLKRLKKMDNRVKIQQTMPQQNIMEQGTWAMYRAYI